MKAEFRKKAIELRRAGYSYSFIKGQIGVSKSTLTLWLHSIPYAPNAEAKAKLAQARLASAEAKRILKADSFKRAAVLARNDLGVLSKRDIFMLGLGIYIREGTKVARAVRIVNSDPNIIRFAIKWFRGFGLDTENFRLRPFLYPDLNIAESVEFWQKTAGLKKENMLRPQIDMRKDKRKDRSGKLPYGTAHLTIVSAGKKDFGVLLFRRILAAIDIVLGSAMNAD